MKIAQKGSEAVAPLRGVAFLKEVYHGGQALRFQALKPDPGSLSLPDTC